MNIDKQYPCVAYMEAAAKRRIPRFVRDYLFHGIGEGASVQKNRDALNGVELMPRYLKEADRPDLHCHFLGREYSAPFGVAPMGLSGLVWPNSERVLAAAAKVHNIPYTLSTVATVSLEEIRTIAGDNAWFQLYTPQEEEVRVDLLRRCQEAGYETIMVTVDVPFKTRRDHDIRNGLSVPPRFDAHTLWQMVTHPNWALRMARHSLTGGVPQFVNLKPYHDAGQSRNVGRAIRESTKFIEERMGLHITTERFKGLRDRWPGKLLVKGVLDPDEAKAYMALGADGVIVSNHGGRQLDAAPSAVEVLPAIRAAVGADTPIIADGGVRSGLDIARMLALGADFVIMGRPFLFALGAMDRVGGEHVMNILKAELQSTLGQLGCASLAELPSTLHVPQTGSSVHLNGTVSAHFQPRHV
ncbi:MAG: alpha-hydroxy acid oxidase [Caldilineaceae bacterium]